MAVKTHDVSLDFLSDSPRSVAGCLGEDPEKGASHLRSLWLWGTKTDVNAHREFSLPVSTPPRGTGRGGRGPFYIGLASRWLPFQQKQY